MILPKVRDPRLVTIRRGGTLTDPHHQLLALWAASCAEHVLALFESAHRTTRDRGGDRPCSRLGAWRGQDDAGARGGRTRQAAARDLRGAAGTPRTPPARRQSCRTSPRTSSARPPTRSRPRGPPRRTTRRRGRASRVAVATRPAPERDPRARARRPAPAQRHLLVGVRLLSAHRPHTQGDAEASDPLLKEAGAVRVALDHPEVVADRGNAQSSAVLRKRHEGSA